MTSNNAEKQISFSNVSSEKDAEDFGAIAVVEQLVTKVVQNEKEIVDVVKKERSSYDFEFKLKVIKDLKDGKLAAYDVAVKHGVHKCLVTKWKQDEKRIITYVAEGRNMEFINVW